MSDNQEIIDVEPSGQTDQAPPQTLVVSSGPDALDQFMPLLSLKDAEKRYKEMRKFVASLMIEGKDFGTIPGTAKPTLFKPGAEKLTTFFGMRKTFQDDKTIEQFDPDNPLFFYRRRCQLWHGDVMIVEASGSANSMEGRYRWRWVKEHELPPGTNVDDLMTRGGKVSEFAFAIENAETGGKYGKPAEYWQQWQAAIKDGTAALFMRKTAKGKEMDAYEMDSFEYRVPNDDIFTLANTILKMAEKRALVAAALIGCNASEFFTQDLEDIGFNAETGEAGQNKPQPKPSSSSSPREYKIPEESITQTELYNIAYGEWGIKDTELVQSIVREHTGEDFRPVLEALRTHIPPEDLPVK